jgi:hypothetical protein
MPDAFDREDLLPAFHLPSRIPTPGEFRGLWCMVAVAVAKGYQLAAQYFDQRARSAAVLERGGCSSTSDAPAAVYAQLQGRAERHALEAQALIFRLGGDPRGAIIDEVEIVLEVDCRAQLARYKGAERPLSPQVFAFLAVLCLSPQVELDLAFVAERMAEIDPRSIREGPPERKEIYRRARNALAGESLEERAAVAWLFQPVGCAGVRINLHPAQVRVIPLAARKRA